MKIPVALLCEATTGLVPVTVYEIPAPLAGEVTVIVPVANEHVGCAVTLAVGADGVTGCAFTVNGVADEVHPSPLVVVTS